MAIEQFRIPAAARTAALALTLAVMLMFLFFKPTTYSLQSGEKLRDVVKAHGIQDTTLLVSDFPGTVAYYTDNRIISADMLTANHHFIDAMVAAPDGICYIFAQALDAGHPVGYVIWSGNNWIRTDDPFTEIRLMHPKTRDQIGQMGVGAPIYLDADTPIIIWPAPTCATVQGTP